MSNNSKPEEETGYKKLPGYKKPSITPKKLGLAISLALIVLGLLFWNPKDIVIEENKPTNGAKQKTQKNSMEVIVELGTKIKNFDTELKNLKDKIEKNGENRDELNKDYEAIAESLKEIKNFLGFKKRVAAAHIFFQHVLKLVFILSGLFGFFWISIWKYREEKEEREIDQRLTDEMKWDKEKIEKLEKKIDKIEQEEDQREQLQEIADKIVQHINKKG